MKVFLLILFIYFQCTAPVVWGASEDPGSAPIEIPVFFSEDNKKDAIPAGTASVLVAERHYQVTYQGPLYQGCAGLCRPQGYEIELDKETCKVIKFTNTTDQGKILYRYNFDSGKHEPLKDGELKRLVEYANIKSELTRIYKRIGHDGKRATAEDYDARVSETLTKENPSLERFSGGGNSCATFFVHLGKIRSGLKCKDWPEYKGELLPAEYRPEVNSPAAPTGAN